MLSLLAGKMPTVEGHARFLSQAVQLEESSNPVIVRTTMLTVSAAIIAFIVWAGLANINEVARTPGEVVPMGFQQNVQHLEGGIVKDIFVHEGEMVDKDQPLLLLDGAGSQEDLARALSKQEGLAMQEERLRAFIDGRQPNFSAFAQSDPNMVSDQKKFFDGMLQARGEERTVIDEQILQKKRAVIMLESDLKTAKSNYAITQNLYNRRNRLNKDGYASDIQLLETKKALNNTEGEMRQLENRISVTKAEIGEFENRLKSLGSGHKNDANERLDQVLGEKLQNAEVIDKLKNRVARLDVKSPAHGIVKGLAVNTIGSVVQSGQKLLEIVPLDEQLIVQVKIPPQHIGHVRAGQKVQVKFSSFDFSRYGVVSGKLDQISATTFTGENGERYFEGRIHLDRPFVGNDPRNRVMPGMTVMAEIVTGEKTILEYLLKPIHIAMKTAFTER